MKPYTLTGILLLLAFSTFAVAKDKADNKEIVMFYVDEIPVTNTYYKQYFLSKGYQQPKDPEKQKAQQAQITNEIINIILLSEEAERQKIHEEGLIRHSLEVARKDVLSRAMILRYLDDITVSEEQLSAAYDRLHVEAVNRTEYLVKQILVDTEQSAQTIIQELKTGKTFEELVKQYSIEGDVNDGSLGWVTQKLVEPEFAQSLPNMQKGSISEQPVKTKFGWHVIKVDDMKRQEIPPLEEIKIKLTELIKQQKMREKVAELRKRSTVKTAAQKMKALPPIK